MHSLFVFLFFTTPHDYTAEAPRHHDAIQRHALSDSLIQLGPVALQGPIELQHATSEANCTHANRRDRPPRPLSKVKGRVRAVKQGPQIRVNTIAVAAATTHTFLVTGSLSNASPDTVWFQSFEAALNCARSR